LTVTAVVLILHFGRTAAKHELREPSQRS
jgi:hypothetical protein